MTALLLVDIQQDFLPGGALPVPRGDAIIPVVNQLLREDFDLIVASKDWHPENHASFAATHGKKIGETIMVKGRPQLLWPVHCVQHLPGAEFAPNLHTEPIQKVVYKGIDPEIDSYSAFFDNAHLRATGLDTYLNKKGVHVLYIAGLATDYCVKATALDALELGYTTYLITDGCRGVDLHPGDVKKALKEMETAGVRFTTSQSWRAV